MSWPRDTGRTATASLRSMTADDAERLAYIANYEGLSKSISSGGSFPYPYKVEHAISLIEYATNASANGIAFHFGIRDEKEELIGVAAVTRIDRENGNCEIGYWLGRDYQRKGYGKYAVSLLVSFAFNGLGAHRVYAVSFSTNAPSIRMLESMGFRHEGTLRGSAKGEDGYVDEIVMAMLKEEFEKSDISRIGT